MPRFVDLSQEIYPKHPVYFAHPDTVIWTDTTFEDSEYIFRQELGVDPAFTYQSRTMQMSEHGPTHVDAIRHYKESGASVTEMPLKQFYGPGVALDVSHREAGEFITSADLEAACEEIGVTVDAGDTVLIHTGHYDATHPSRTYNEDHPGLNADATKWLIERDVKSFGIDQPSPDVPSANYPCHALCTKHELPHMENLRNIDELVDEDFTFAGFPLALRDGTGSPIRAVGIIED